jgi:integrase
MAGSRACQQLQQYDGHLSRCPPRTASSQRVTALDRTTVIVLRRYHAAQQAERTAMGDGCRDSGYVFTGLNGDPMAPDRLTRHFRQLSDEAGLPPVRLHDLRTASPPWPQARNSKPSKTSSATPASS